MRFTLVLLAACTPAEPEPKAQTTTPTEEPCKVGVVADIDETLTANNDEYLTQLLDTSYDPEERPDAAELMQAYASAGYTVFYVTARGEEAFLDDTTPRELTEGWLLDHGFPVEEGTVFLYPGLGGTAGQGAIDYKTEVLQGLVDDGWRLDHGYGNADTDIEAFKLFVPAETLYMVGELAGEYEGQPIYEEEAYTSHLEELAIPDATCD